MNSNGNNHKSDTLILGIGNILMGDEGVGVRVVEEIQKAKLPVNVTCLDGGTGSFLLLDPMQSAGKVILIDATVDGAPAGTLRRLQPRFSSDYPRTLTAHDIGLKDLLDTFYLLGNQPEVVLYAVSIPPLHEMGLDLTPQVASRIPEIARQILAEVNE
ncbi:MAG: HyaD/HybD family hydrogenase maturation endopeptidase [Acidobacteria bacterium]|nr:HyaD/HybD family hydrogenase maturation endopeptidase [Acidobacteriota bacterium]